MTGGIVYSVDQQQQQQADATIDIIPYVTTSNSNSNSSSNSAITERKRKRNHDTTSNDSINAFSETVYEDDDHNDADDNYHDEDHANKDENEYKDEEGALVSSSSENKMGHTFNYYGNNNISRVDTTTTTTTNNKAVRGIFEQEEENEEESTDNMNVNDDDNVDVSSMAENDINGGKEQNYININGGGAALPSSSSVLATAKSKFDARWMELYQRLIAYKKEHDDSTKVPRKYEKDPTLGRWVARQRTINNNNKLLHDRHSLLDSIDFDWGTGPQGPHTDWMEMYQRLLAYKKEHDDSTKVPRNYKKDPTLGRWVAQQRTINNNNKLLPDRYSLLGSIDFDWGAGLKGPNTDWMEMYQRLVVYKKQHNTTNVPAKYKENLKLARWVVLQRELNNNNKLLHDRRTLLDSIIFDWGNGPRGSNTDWMETYQRLVAYKQQYNNTNVLKRSKEYPKLGTWVHNQRRDYRNKTIKDERCQLLNSIDFDWGNGPQGPRESIAEWMEMYHRLVAYKKQHSNTNVPLLYNEDLKLGTWCKNQRRAFTNKGTYLSEERCTLLNSIGFE